MSRPSLDQAVPGPFSYGKAAICFVDIDRRGGMERARQVTARVRLTGGIDEAYLDGDNARMVTTDALADLVQERCGQLAGEAPETMAVEAVAALVARYPHLPDVAVALDVVPLEAVAEATHAHVRSTTEVAGATARWRGSSMRCRSRLRGLSLVRTSGSRFEGFLVDCYTTTRPSTDRAVGGAVEARWLVRADGHQVDGAVVRSGVREALVSGFASEDSASVQQLVLRMARCALVEVGELEAIEVALASVRLSPPLRVGPAGAARGSPPPRTLGLAKAPRGEVRVRLRRSALAALSPPGPAGPAGGDLR